MRFSPYYTVSYRGNFYRAGSEFEIADCDVDFMMKHGNVIGEKPSEMGKTSQAVNANVEQKSPLGRLVDRVSSKVKKGGVAF